LTETKDSFERTEKRFPSFLTRATSREAHCTLGVDEREKGRGVDAVMKQNLRQKASEAGKKRAERKVGLDHKTAKRKEKKTSTNQN